MEQKNTKKLILNYRNKISHNGFYRLMIGNRNGNDKYFIVFLGYYHQERGT